MNNKLDEIYTLYKNLSYEEIIETIKNSQDDGDKCYFYIRLLRHHIYENKLDVGDIVIGENEKGIPIVIPNDYEIEIIDELEIKDSEYISFEEFTRELKVDEYRKCRYRHFIK